MVSTKLSLFPHYLKGFLHVFQQYPNSTQIATVLESLDVGRPRTPPSVLSFPRTVTGHYPKEPTCYWGRTRKEEWGKHLLEPPCRAVRLEDCGMGSLAPSSVCWHLKSDHQKFRTFTQILIHSQTESPWVSRRKAAFSHWHLGEEGLMSGGRWLGNGRASCAWDERAGIGPSLAACYGFFKKWPADDPWWNVRVCEALVLRNPREKEQETPGDHGPCHIGNILIYCTGSYWASPPSFKRAWPGPPGTWVLNLRFSTVKLEGR